MPIEPFELNRLRKFLTLGLPVHEVCEVMHISRRTYFRYKRVIDKENKELMFKDAEASMITTLQLFQDRLGQTIVAMTTMERDDKRPDFVRQQAARIKLEATWAQAALQAEGPNIITKMSKAIRAIAYGTVPGNSSPQELMNVARPEGGYQRVTTTTAQAPPNPDSTYILSPDMQYSRQTTTTTSQQPTTTTTTPQRPPSPIPPLPGHAEPPPVDPWPQPQDEEQPPEEDFDPEQDPDPDPSEDTLSPQEQLRRRLARERMNRRNANIGL